MRGLTLGGLKSLKGEEKFFRRLGTKAIVTSLNLNDPSNSGAQKHDACAVHLGLDRVIVA